MRSLRPALLAVATLALASTLSGCFLLPEGESAAPTPEPSVEPTIEVSVAPTQGPNPLVVTGRGNCPREALEALLNQSSDPERDPATLREIDPERFAPSSLAPHIAEGCVYALTYVGRQGSDVTYQNALVPGGDELFDAMEASLLARGYEDVTNHSADGSNGGANHVTWGEYRDPNYNSVILWTSNADTINWNVYNGPGFSFLGDEFVIVQSLVLPT